MLEVGKKLEGVVTVCDGESWLTTAKKESVDRVLIRQAVHHFNQETLKEAFTGLYRVLKPGGKVCITKRGDLQEMFPWPSGFYEKMCEEEKPVEELANILRDVGFKQVFIKK